MRNEITQIKKMKSPTENVLPEKVSHSSRLTASVGASYFKESDMNDYTARQLQTLDERIAMKKAEKERLEKFLRQEADSSMRALAYYCIPAAIIGLIILGMLVFIKVGA